MLRVEKYLAQKNNNNGVRVCVPLKWEIKQCVNVSAHTKFAHVMRGSHALLKVCGVYRRPSLWTVFLFICRFQRPSAVPLINLPWKKNTGFQASAGCWGISEQSMRGASVKEAAAGPGDVGEGENLSMNPTIYPVQRCREQRESSIFPLQQPSIAHRLSPTALLHDCSCYRMVRCLSGETEQYPDQWALVQMA